MCYKTVYQRRRPKDFNATAQRTANHAIAASAIAASVIAASAIATSAIAASAIAASTIAASTIILNAAQTGTKRPN
jgi:hypothetical protein